MYSEEDDFDCPLCMEELDISDRNFRPCPCGYQICRFCWHHIKEDLNGRCPACRRVYSEETVEFTPISADELAMIKNEKKAKEREKKEIEAMNRKHLANMRVVQKSLVYVIGLPPKLANDEHTLRQHEYFGQYGKISKVVINRRNAPIPSAGSSPGVPSVGVYITYARKEDAAKAIAAIDGSIWDGKILRASYGTTKYCTYYLRGMNCQNPNCMYLHEPGEDADSYTKEDLAVGKHHLQEHIVPYDPSIHKPAVLGRPTLSTQSSSSSSLTPRPKPATVASYHPNSSSLSDWPAPGERSYTDDKDKDKDDEGSALPATASWAKIGSNPSTPTLMNSKPLSRKPTTEPPPLHAKGSTSSIITGVVVNNSKQKDPAHNDPPVIYYSPTPAEALAIEAAAKQQVVQEQRLIHEQQRKVLKKQQKQEETDLQAELLNQKLKKQKQLEHERDQQELQKQKQQQEMEQKMLQTQKDKEQQRSEQKEKEARDKKERETRDTEKRNEMEEKRQKIEELERNEKELYDLEERRRKQMDSMFVSTPTLSLGSFSFNPDASLATQPSAFGNGGGLMSFGSETPGAFGLDSFSAFSNLPVTPGHYTGSFNPFSLDDEPLMRRPAAPPTRSFLDDADYDPITGRSRQVGPPIPGKPRQTSRFGFATDSQYSDSFSNDRYSAPQTMQDGLRSLFPNVNVSFGAPNGSLSAQQQHQFQQQQQQQQQYSASPLFHRQDPMQASGWDTSDKQDLQMLQRNMSQLNMDTMPATPSSRMAEYHQQLQMQQHSQRSGPPGITRNSLTPSMVKSPPPGLESVARSDINNWTGLQQLQQRQQQQLQQQLQQQHHQTSRMNGWSGENSMSYMSNAGGSSSQDGSPDIFGAFLKAAAASPQNQSANLSSGNQGNHGSLGFQDPAIMSARISAASKASLVEALQNPPPSSNLTGYRISPSQDGMRSLSNDTMSGRFGEVDKAGDAQQTSQQRQLPTRQSTPESPSSLQNIPLGSKRKEIKSVKGVLNSGMNAPLNGSSRSHPSSTPGSPLVEPRIQTLGQQQLNQQQQHASFGAGETNMMTGMTSATARSAKVKSDLLMGLNSPGFRADRFSAAAMRESAEISHDQENPTKMNDLYGPTGGQYSMNEYGQPIMSGSGSGATTISGPPPGLGMPSSNGNNSPYLMSNLLGQNQENGVTSSTYLSNNKPLDVAGMMNALEFFGPGQASSLMMSPNWPAANVNNVNGSQRLGAYNDQNSNDNLSNPSASNSNNNNSGNSSNGNGNDPNTNDTNSASPTSRSVEDLELQVINAKMETQMLENQLNAVIKRNRRKLYA
ncbi:transcriptional repressor proteinral negative regulator of transcription subunit 4 [Mortierella sp. AM989]|nr:transcriptional repressor proteinral negative regulator of transcription subunit 4 [Mortierella sp. AM989]